MSDLSEGAKRQQMAGGCEQHGCQWPDGLGKLILERDRFKLALERIVSEDRELFCNFCSAAEIAREALNA